MNKTLSSVVKLIISLGLGFLIIFLVARNFAKPLKMKLDSNQFSKTEVWTLDSWNEFGDYTMVGDTLAYLKDGNDASVPLISIYEGVIETTEVTKGDVIVPNKDTVAKIKVDIWKVTRDAFSRANYWWIILSMVLSLLSHYSRAYRWKMMFKPMGYAPKMGNAFGAILVMYLSNLAFPRLGEVLRCSILARYDKIPIHKSFGTMITERIVDVICLFGLMGFCFVLQRQIFIDFYNTYMPDNGNSKFIILGALGLGVIIFYILFKTDKLPFKSKIQGLVKGVWDGVISVKNMERPLVYIGHTIFIWIMYYAMTAVCFKALPETSSITVLAALPILFFGAIAMVAVQGGLGLYPYFVSKILIMYGLAETVGYAFGWLIWSAQTVLVVVSGLIAYLLLVTLNKEPKTEVPT